MNLHFRRVDSHLLAEAAKEGHEVYARRRSLGSTMRGGRLSGVEIWCKCGWRDKVNEPASRNGARWARDKWIDHAREILIATSKVTP